MKEKFTDKSSALFSKNSSYIPNNDNDKSNNADSKEDYYAKLASSTAMIVKHFGKLEKKKFSGPRILSP